MAGNNNLRKLKRRDFELIENDSDKIQRLSEEIDRIRRGMDIGLQIYVDRKFHELLESGSKWNSEDRRVELIERTPSFKGGSIVGPIEGIKPLFSKLCELLDEMMGAKLDSNYWEVEELIQLFHFYINGEMYAKKIKIILFNESRKRSDSDGAAKN